MNSNAQFVGVERRQTVAHGVSGYRGYRAARLLSPGWAKESVAPSGAWFDSTRNPTAGAVGYHRPPLRDFQMMPWIVKNLWLIPALPILAAGLSALARSAGAERRETVAHGASRGYGVVNIISPGGATE
jgi:hypothetical protein